MQRPTAFAPGWLRAEIKASVNELLNNPRIPQEQKDAFQRAEYFIEHSEALRRSSELFSASEADGTRSFEEKK